MSESYSNAMVLRASPCCWHASCYRIDHLSLGRLQAVELPQREVVNPIRGRCTPVDAARRPHPALRPPAELAALCDGRNFPRKFQVRK